MIKILCLLLISNYSYAKELKVLIIDTGINVNTEIFQYFHEDINNDNYVDTYGHGTSIANIVLSNICNKVEAYSCKYTNNFQGDIKKSNECFKKALSQHFDIINYSSYGKEFNMEEFEIFKQLQKKKVIIVVASGNDNKYLGSPCFNSFPSCFRLNNVISIGSINYEYKKSNFSNFGLPELIYTFGEHIPTIDNKGKYTYLNGTSAATALYTNSILRRFCNEK